MLSGVGIVLCIPVKSQVVFSPQYMARGEYRHGYKSLADTNQNPAVFISQRARLTGEYKANKYRIVLGIQDVRTWGSVANSSIDTKGLLSVSEAFAEITPNNKIAVSVGRQILSYDDDRIFGNFDWAMQARRHDLALFKFTDSTIAIHVGAAYNQNQDQTSTTVYTVANNYKTLQYLWLNKITGKFNSSFFFLNNGMQYVEISSNGKNDSSTVFSQTTGLRTAYKNKKLGCTAYAYFQFGKDGSNKKLSAYDVSAEASYNFTKEFFVTVGAEWLSGTSQTDTSNKTNNSFYPLYGTNHKFNGYMDYFYVGNHNNSVGLVDVYLKFNYTYKRVMFNLNTHSFNAASEIRDKKNTSSISSLSSNLGTEIDFTCSYNITDEVALQAGYSQMFGTSSMTAVKGGNTGETSNWAYVMLLVRPGKIRWPKSGLKM